MTIWDMIKVVGAFLLIVPFALAIVIVTSCVWMALVSMATQYLFGISLDFCGGGWR